jgi:integrase
MQYRPEKTKPYIVQYRTTEVDKNGNVLSKVKTASFANKKQAQEFEGKVDQRKTAIKHGLKVPAHGILMMDHMKDWLRRREKDKEIAYSTFDGEERKIRRFWLQRIGSLPTNMIDSPTLLEALNELQFDQGVSPATRNRHRALLSALFDDAKKLGRCTMNPALDIELVKEVRTRKRVNLKDDDQYHMYLDGLKAESFDYWLIGMIMGYTGARICMANALQFGDVDHIKGTVQFRRIEERAGGSKIVDRIKGKTQIDDEQDVHVIPLVPDLQEAVLAAKARRKKIKATDFIAQSASGSYIPYDTWKDVHARVVARLELPPITSHAIRRFFATELKRYGFSRAEIRELGGWSSEAVVARYDLKDVEHLAAKIRSVGFGAGKNSNVVELKTGSSV